MLRKIPIVFVIALLLVFSCSPAFAAEDPGATVPAQVETGALDDGIYPEVYEILRTAIYGQAELTSTQQLALDQLATTMSLITALFPILVVVLVMKAVL